MKECPNCKNVYADDLSFCLNDGVPLAPIAEAVDRSALTEAAPAFAASLPTEVLPKVYPSVETQESVRPVQAAPRRPSKLPYLAIGALAFVCVILAIALVAMNRDRLFAGANNKPAANEETKPTPTPSPLARTVPVTNTNAAVNQSPKQLAPTYNVTGSWNGQWSVDSGTLLDINISLSDTQNNGVEGQIRWTLRKTVRPDKVDKVGLTAVEYVRCTFDPATGTLQMRGYRKDDPNNVLVMLDEYRLNVSSDGRTLSGIARNGGKWNGHLRLTM